MGAPTAPTTPGAESQLFPYGFTLQASPGPIIVSDNQLLRPNVTVAVPNMAPGDAQAILAQKGPVAMAQTSSDQAGPPADVDDADLGHAHGVALIDKEPGELQDDPAMTAAEISAGIKEFHSGPHAPPAFVAAAPGSVDIAPIPASITQHLADSLVFPDV